MPKIKNIIIFIIIAAIFVLIYMYFIKKSPDTPALVSSSPSSTTSNTADTGTSPSADSSLVTQNFLNLLLSVKNISLKDTIFSDEAFISLHDSSITLIPDGNEGRVNPFAPLGTDAVATGVSTTP
ncbi:hypothetical protein A3A03_02595 [Candidatus Nomurabacteria bacterium RIFCSPLOWO2_01_FULL_40_18]|uniref:Uncharacterized protein n=1 Tax=Candidatus Nomurabacteria bacterium RIFCSPLOWO2_01_FULL_40_18 TaxID=1801773 RepID=A0A1F6XKB2_9BACT|nr:MAG: hypothetical protein A3A03_02595 [Candidatus Nomurabacteria bacterium RIFCSPLOWO2_01_FULL_40_18]